MHEQLLAKDFYTNVVPSRASRVETYLWDRADDMSAEIAADLYRPGQPIQSTCVLIPVAAHQETHNIAPALAAYAAQRPIAAFSILMLLNYPKGADTEAVSRTITEISLAKGRHPNLDVRYSLHSYEQPTIGQVRKDLWDATARLALREGTFETVFGDVIAINHDIDTVSMTPRYIQHIQKNFVERQMALKDEGLETEPLESRYTAVRHAYPTQTHPNVARALFWGDFVTRQAYPDGCYEEGLVVPLSWYAKQGGIDGSYKTHETRRLGPREPKGISGTVMQTSPRRYIERLSIDSEGPIWQETTFTPHDRCRVQEGSDIGDISFQQAENRIFSNLEDDLYSISWSRSQGRFFMEFEDYVSDIAAGVKQLGEDRDRFETLARTQVEPRLFLAKNVLQRIIGSDSLAGLVDTVTTHVVSEFVDDFIETTKSELKTRFNIDQPAVDSVNTTVDTCASVANLLN